MTSPDPTEFGVALIGYGFAGSAFHAPLLATVPGLRLRVVVTSNEERAEQAIADHPGVRIESSVDPVWDDPAIRLVVVATPNRTHVPLARQAIDSGLAVVVDKPLAASASDARMLIERARERGVMLTVYQNRRWDGDFLTLRRLIADGALGEIRRFESRFERWRPEPKPGWRQSSAPEDAGGLLFDLGSHLIDQALLLFGPVARVYAELDRRATGSEVDDDSFVALTHGSGVRSHLWMSTMAGRFGPRLRVLGATAAYTKYGLDVQEAALLRGERPGGDAWGEEPPECWGELGAGEEASPVRTEAGRYHEFYRGVLAALRGDSSPPVDPADAVVVLEVIEAARESAGSGRVVVPGHI
jgi:scyllo-inositol 2-dehydrogenase (NADP+)